VNQLKGTDIPAGHNFQLRIMLDLKDNQKKKNLFKRKIFNMNNV